MCPSGSNGLLQSGHGGRPAATTSLGVLGEITCLAEGQKDPQSVGPVLPVLQHDLLADLLLGQGKQFDDHLRALTVPGQAHRADPELRLDRRGQREFAGRDAAGSVGLGAEPAGHLGDQRAEAIGEHRYLLFLAGDGKHPPAVDDLQEEFAFAGLPDGSGKEPVG